jgi:archaellum biogenesis ATPase FlaH
MNPRRSATRAVRSGALRIVPTPTPVSPSPREVKAMQSTGDAALRAQLATLPTDWRLVRVNGKKAPIAGDDWFNVDSYSPDDAAELSSQPPAWGLKCGPDSGGTLVLDLDAPGWRDSFQEVTGHPITDLPRTIGWSSGKPERSAHAFTVDRDWWPYLRNRVPFTRPWQEGDPLAKDGSRKAVTVWELRWDRHQSVLIGAHPETGSYRWLDGRSPVDIPEPTPAPDWLLNALVIQEIADVEPVVPTAEDADRAVAMLRHLPPADFAAYDDWLRVGMALHHTDRGLLTAWVDWSRGTPTFDEAECLRKWASFGKGHRGRPASIATLHHLAKGYGYREPKRSRKAAASGDGSQRQQQDADPSPAEVARRPYRELLADTLQAIRDGDQDAEMELRAEIMGRFKRSDSQINAALFGLLTKQEGGTTAATYGAIDVGNIAPSHWLIDGFVPANDQVLLYGEAGAGKTTAALELAFAVVDGTGLLDRSALATAGKVLFISSDSGRRPLLTLMNHAGLEDHPAVRDGRFLIWAHSPEEGRIAWDASVAGCLALLQAIQRESISLVLIDSCKAVTSKAEIDYTSNAQISALLTFFQEVVCQHCSIVWLNHDGTANGATAGAKAWKEIPSSVHSIEMVAAGAERDGEGGKGKGVRVNPELRNWRVRKCRQGTAREFIYRVDGMTGRLIVTAAVEIVGDCSAAVLQVLREAHRRNQPSVGTQELLDRCLQMPGSYSSKTVRNTLTNLVNARTIVRPSRGRYALSPKQKELMGGGVHAGREDKGREASEELGSSFVPTPSRARDIGTNDPVPDPDVCPEVPAEKSLGTKPNASEGLGSSALSSRGAWAPPPESGGDTPLPADEALIDRLIAVRQQHPADAPASLALVLDPDGALGITGRKVKDWLSHPGVQARVIAAA